MQKQSSFGKSTFAIIEADGKIEVHEYKRGQCRIETGFECYSQAEVYVKLCMDTDKKMWNK